MRANRPLAVLILSGLVLATGVSSHAAGTAKTDDLSAHGLTKAGDTYVLADEKAVLDGMKSLQKSKLEADKETRARHAIDLQIAAKRRVAKAAEKEWSSLESRLSLVTDVGVHNRIVLRMNRLAADHKEAMEAQKDLEEQAGKVSTENKTKFVDNLLALNQKAEDVGAKYKALADDAQVKAAIDKINAASATKVSLGPSREFTAAADELKKWQSQIDSEAIPLREENGVHLVDAQLNGEHFVMGVDTGASSICLPFDVAEKLSMVPGEQDPTVEMQLADGNVIQGKEMTLKSVRVGRFTLNDVTCIVLQKEATKAPVILGNSFLNHFIVRMDPSSNELHLTQLKEEATKKISVPSEKKDEQPGSGL